MMSLDIQTALQTAVSLHRAGQLQEAAASYRRILAQEPGNPDALHLLGILAAQTDHADHAVELIRQAIRARPANAEFHANLALALKKAARYDQAITAYRRAAQLRPDHPEFWFNLGNACLEHGEFEQAVAAFQKSAELRPTHHDAVNNLGAAFTRLGDLQRALAAYRRALRLDPAHAATHGNLAATLYNLGRLDEATAAARRAIDIDANCAEAHLTLAASLLVNGDFTEGWREYDWRCRCKSLRGAPSPYPQPTWDGSDPTGRTILLCCEQGLGDAIQFARYAPLVAARGARVILGCRAPLKALLQTVRGAEQVVAEGEPLPPLDLQVPLMSLPRLFGTTLGTIPAAVPYVDAERSKCDFWRTKLSEGVHAFRVGLIWAGHPQNRNDRWRSIPLRAFAPLAAIPGVVFHSLQGGDAAKQIEGSPLPLIDHHKELHDFSDVAALAANLDLVVSVDTAAAHLAGALGKPVWTLVPYAPDWRWLLRRKDSPWYPTMRLFRQSALGDWAGVISRITKNLASLAARKP